MISLHEEEQLAVKTAKEVLARHKQLQTHLIPALQEIQERLGYIPGPAMRETAVFFNMTPVEIYSVVTFYHQFRLTPPGKNQVKVCLGTACHMKGGQIIMDSWQRALGINEGATTPDREFSLERVACVGCCTLAPVALVNNCVHGKITPTGVEGLLFAHRLEKKEKDDNGCANTK